MWMGRHTRIFTILRDYPRVPCGGSRDLDSAFLLLKPFWKATKIAYLQAAINATGIKGAKRRAVQKYANKYARMPQEWYRTGKIS